MTGQPFFVPALILVMVSIPLVAGWIPRNRIYGVRTAKTLADDRLWRSANRFGGMMLILAGLVYLTVAWLLPCGDPAKEGLSAAWLTQLAAFVLPIALALLATHLYVRKH